MTGGGTSAACFNHGRSHHPLFVEYRIEETDIVGDGAGKQLIFLHHRADLLPICPRPDDGERRSVDQDLAARRLEQAEHQLYERRLAAAGGAHDSEELSRLDGEIDVFEDQRFGLRIAEGEVAQLDPPVDPPAIFGRLIVPVFDRRERDVGQALQMQAEDPEFEGLLD
jgi:hypothetical protein